MPAKMSFNDCGPLQAGPLRTPTLRAPARLVGSTGAAAGVPGTMISSQASSPHDFFTRFPCMEGGTPEPYDVVMFGPDGRRTYMRFLGDRVV